MARRATTTSCHIAVNHWKLCSKQCKHWLVNKKRSIDPSFYNFRHNEWIHPSGSSTYLPSPLFPLSPPENLQTHNTFQTSKLNTDILTTSRETLSGNMDLADDKIFINHMINPLHSSIGGLVVKLAVAIHSIGQYRLAPGSIPGRCILHPLTIPLGCRR